MAYWTGEPCDVLRLVARLRTEFDCKVQVHQVNELRGRRACHIIERANPQNLAPWRVLLWALAGPLPASEVESLLLQLRVPLRAFGIEQGFPPTPPKPVLH